MAKANKTTPEIVVDDRPSRTANHPHNVPDAPLLPVAAQTAHDLASFLTGIRLLVQSLSHVSPDKPVVQRHIASLQQTTLHASELCAQLQKTLAGKNDALKLKMCKVDIGAMVSAMRRLLEVMVRPGVTVDVEATAGLLPVIANPTQLRQVVLDLVTNASDASESHNGVITIRTGVFKCTGRPDLGSFVTPDRIDADECVFLEVTDAGCGIAKEKLQRIFEPTYTTKKDGQGLGLASVLQIVRGCGGAISVDSRVGEGTRVRCIFPSATPHQLKTADDEAAADPIVEQCDSRATTVLLIEDNEAVRYGSKLLLENSESSDFRVLTAGNGQEAMRLFQQQMGQLTIVVLDLNLPDCQGADLFRKMRQLVPAIPVIVASGLSEEQLLAHCDGQIPNGFLVKPFDGDVLIRKINSILRSSCDHKGIPAR